MEQICLKTEVAAFQEMSKQVIMLNTTKLTTRVPDRIYPANNFLFLRF